MEPEIKLDFEQRTEANRILAQVVDEPEWAAATIVGLRAENARLTADLSKLRDDLETLIQQRDEAQRRRGEIEAECEALRADVVWLLAHKMIGYGDRISYAKEPRSWSLRKELDHDGTPDGILRAVREAREG